MCAIILIVKKQIAILLSAVTLAALAAAGYGAKTEYVSAEEGSGTENSTVYPDFVSELDIGEISCYAVGDGSFAFASGEFLYVYSGGSRSLNTDTDGAAYYEYEGGVMDAASDENIYACEHTSTISTMCYDGGTLYFTDATGAAYSYAAGSHEPTAFTPQDGEGLPSGLLPVSYPVTANGLSYYVRDGGVLSIGDGTAYATFEDGTYSQVKVQNGSVYALRDGALCIIEGTSLDEITTPRAINFLYTDITHGETIAIGDCDELLGQTKDTQFAIVPAGQYVTEVDLSQLGGQYFVTGEEGTFRTESSSYALVLCSAGEADIIAIGDKTYITSPLGAKINAVTATAPFDGAQLNYTAGLYSSPYMCDATLLKTLETGTTVSVLYAVNAEDQSSAAGTSLTADFCRVQYTAQDGTVTEGYVASSFLTAYDFSGEDGEFTDPTTPDDYSEDNVILTVVLVIVIVVLVIAGVAYLAYFSGAGKRKKNGAENKDNHEDKNG